MLQAGLQFLLSPGGCAGPDWLLLLVSSAPGEADLRTAWRLELELLETEAGRGVKVGRDISPLSSLLSHYNSVFSSSSSSPGLTWTVSPTV